MSNLELLSISILSVSIGLIGLYVMYRIALKRLFSVDLNENFYELVTDFIDNASQDEEFLKKLQIIGIVLGTGLKQGIGLDKLGGKKKFNLTDLIPIALSAISGGGNPLANILGGLGGNAEASTQPSTQNSNNYGEYKG